MKVEDSESSFMSSFRGGSVVAFNAIWEQYRDALFLYARGNFTKDPCLANEAVAKAFAALWQWRGRMENHVHIKRFLYKTTQYACLDGNKSSGRRNARFINVPDYDTLNGLAADEGFAADHRIIRAELKAALFKMIDALPENCREVFKMHNIEGLSVKEIAERLSISPKTIYDRLKDARQQLQLNSLKK